MIMRCLKYSLKSWSFLYELEKDRGMEDNLSLILESIVSKQEDSGLFIFNNPTTRKHQNQMFTLWAIGKAIEVLNRKEYLTNIKKTLDYTINHRLRSDGAFLWEDASQAQKLKSKLIKVITGEYSAWELLFECHQTFFVNAVLQYYIANGGKDYDRYVDLALNWIFGNNVLNRNLIEVSDIGVPMRMMNTKGNMNLSGQNFKGAYEIGSYIMALTGFLLGKQSSGGQRA